MQSPLGLFWGDWALDDHWALGRLGTRSLVHLVAWALGCWALGRLGTRALGTRSHNPFYLILYKIKGGSVAKYN